MGNQAAATERSAGTLIRTIEGHITFWSPSMAQRYGFTSEEALGRVSHELLRTLFPHALRDIADALVDRKSWSGGLILHRADGQSVMAANHWYFHADLDGRGAFVTEVHSDIARTGTVAYAEIADMMAAIAHEMAEPLTAIGSYSAAAQRILDSPWPNSADLREAVTRIAGQVPRTAETVRLLRDLANLLREAG